MVLAALYAGINTAIQCLSFAACSENHSIVRAEHQSAAAQLSEL
jgi:hypothetical protein